MDGAIVREQDGLIIYRASALGSSFKSLVAARLNYEPMPPPEKMQVVFDAGKDAEDVVVKRLVDDGWKLYDQQKEVLLPITKRIAVMGHIDGKGYHVGEGRVIEIKSQTQEAWDAFERDGWDAGLFPKYRWQVSSYMLAEHLGLCLVRYNRDTEQTKVSYVDIPHYGIEDIRRRVLQVEFQALTGELPDDRTCADYPCPYFYLHDKEERIVLDDPQIEALAKEYRQALVDEKAAKGRKKAAFTALKDTCGDELKLETENGWKITFYYQNNPQGKPETYDGLSTLLVAWLMSQVEPFVVKGKSLRVRITPAKGDGDSDE